MGLQQLGDRGVQGRFFRVHDAEMAKSWVNPLSTKVDSDQASEDHVMTGMAPAMAELKGGAPYARLNTQLQTVRNVEFSANLEVPEIDWRRDKTGQILRRIGELGRRGGPEHWESLLSALILLAESEACYDGQYYFDSDHKDPGAQYQTNQANLGSVDISALGVGSHGVATCPSDEEAMMVIAKAIAAILTFVDDRGQPTNQSAKRFVAMIGTADLWAPVMAACTKSSLSGGKTNVLLGEGFTVEPVLNARLSSLTDSIDVYRADAPLWAPFIRQEEVPTELTPLGPGSEHAAKHRTYLYAAYASRKAAYGDWRQGYRARMV